MRRRLVSGLLLLALPAMMAVAMPGRALAAVAPACNKSGSFLGLPAWYKYLEVGPKDNDPCAIIGPKDSEDNFDWTAAVPLVVLAIVEILLRISALVAIAFVVVGGVKFISSQGEPDAAKNARGTVINALIGLAIVVTATTLVNFLGRTFAP